MATISIRNLDDKDFESTEIELINPFESAECGRGYGWVVFRLLLRSTLRLLYFPPKNTEIPQQIKMASIPDGMNAIFIGLGRFELPTPCPPDKYAKPLRYSPMLRRRINGNRPFVRSAGLQSPDTFRPRCGD